MSYTRALAQDYIERGEYTSALWLIPRPERAAFLAGLVLGPRLEGRESLGRSLLIEAWTDAEFPHQNRRLWEAMFRRFGYITDSETPMPQGELVIFRGQRRGVPLGMSWTLDREKAEWFARRFHHFGPHELVKGEIPSALVYAYIVSRRESEIVVNPRRVRKVERFPV